MKKQFIKAFCSFEEAEAWDIAYWNAQTPAARLRAMERLRKINYGYARYHQRLPQIFTSAQRP